MPVTKKGVKVKIAALYVDGTGHSEGTVVMVPEARRRCFSPAARSRRRSAGRAGSCRPP